jgi:hypothetical protein
MNRRQVQNGQTVKRRHSALGKKRTTQPAVQGPRRPLTLNLDKLLKDQNIVVSEALKVRSYLHKHLQLGKILTSVCARARQEFGKESELALSIYQDPEINDRHLTLIVRLSSYDENLTSRLDRVTEPFEEELCEASGYLLVTTDFRSPREKNGI